MIEAKKIYCIYKITSLVNNKVYVGSTVDFNRRVNEHLKKLNKGVHPNLKLQYHFNKHGAENIQFSILELVLYPELLIKREQFYIDSLNPEFNICRIAGSCLGRKHTPESIIKIKDKRRNQKNIGSGWHHTEETKAAHSDRMKKVIQEYPHNARKVIDTKTNVVYDSLKEAAIANNLSSPRLYYRIKSGCTKSSLAYL